MTGVQAIQTDPLPPESASPRGGSIRFVPQPRQELAAARVDLRRERVAFETDHHRIEGSLVLPREGYRSRLSDYVNQRDRDFFPLQDATVAPRNDPERYRGVPFLMVARAHIRLAIPMGTEDHP